MGLSCVFWVNLRGTMNIELKIVDFTCDPKKYLNTAPSAVCCFGHEETIETWEDALVAICKALYRYHPLRFDKTTTCLAYGNLISRSERNLRTPRMFSQCRYVETDFNAAEIITKIRQLIDSLGIQSESVQIYYLGVETEIIETQPELAEDKKDKEDKEDKENQALEILKSHDNIVDFGFDVPSHVYIYTKPVCLTINTVDGYFQTHTPFETLHYHFKRWENVLERILSWMTLINANLLVDILRHHCHATVAQALAFSDIQLKKPFLLKEDLYIDLAVFEHNTALCLETIRILAKCSKISSDILKISFEIDETLNNHASQPVDNEYVKTDIPQMNVEEDDVEDIGDDNIEDVEDVKDIEDDEDDEDVENVEDIDDDDIDDIEEEDDAPGIRYVEKHYEFVLADDNWDAYIDDKAVAYNGKKVDSWSDLFAAFCDEIYDIEGDSLIEMLNDISLIDEDKTKYQCPSQIGGSGFYIETDRESRRILQLMGILCDELEIDKESICIETSAMVEVDDDDDDDDEDDADEDDADEDDADEVEDDADEVDDGDDEVDDGDDEVDDGDDEVEDDDDDDDDEL